MLDNDKIFEFDDNLYVVRRGNLLMWDGTRCHSERLCRHHGGSKLAVAAGPGVVAHQPGVHAQEQRGKQR